MRRDTITVPDLSSPALSTARSRLADRMKEVIGVDEVRLDVRSDEVVITYDEGWIGEAGLMGVIQDAGFTVPDMPERPTE